MTLVIGDGQNVFQCGALTFICVATTSCHVSIDACTECHAVSHRADQSGVLPTSLLSGGRYAAVMDVIQSDFMNMLKPLYIFLCGNNEGSRRSLHFH